MFAGGGEDWDKAVCVFGVFSKMVFLAVMPLGFRRGRTKIRGRMLGAAVNMQKTNGYLGEHVLSTINARGFFQNNALGPLESCLYLTLLRHMYKYNGLPIDSHSLNHSIAPLL